jgi:hypothetical protein
VAYKDKEFFQLVKMLLDRLAAPLRRLHVLWKIDHGKYTAVMKAGSGDIQSIFGDQSNEAVPLYYQSINFAFGAVMDGHKDDRNLDGLFDTVMYFGSEDWRSYLDYYRRVAAAVGPKSVKIANFSPFDSGAVFFFPSSAAAF